VRQVLDLILAAVGKPTPPELADAVGDLSSSAWPELVDRWSVLTPSGCPIELTLGEDDNVLRWTSEIAGPEVAESHRVGLVARRLTAAGQAVRPPLLSTLLRLQQGCELKYGAWLGGRSRRDGVCRFKLYAEVPAMPHGGLRLPPPLSDAIALPPPGWTLRMIGFEPLGGRAELYFRLPGFDREALRRFFTAAGHAYALGALERCLPDGLRRLIGRRLGASVAIGEDGTIDLALFVSARTLFPGAPELLATLIPVMARLPAPLARPTLVTLRLDPVDRRVAYAVGITVSARMSNLGSGPPALGGPGAESPEPRAKVRSRSCSP
jgi:hypothetical protein